MKIRTGGLADIPDILSMLDGAIAWLAAQGRTGQWGDQPFSTDRPGWSTSSSTRPSRS